MKRKSTLVSIGLPVYNGDNFIGDAIESILNQTFEDFELIISDNASTDRTEKICKTYAKMDPRIRYYRNSKNIGAAANFNKTFHLSIGEYFKWAAHDDICKDNFLQRCVEILENIPDAVTAYTKTIEIDEKKNVIEYYDVKLPTDSLNPAVRYENILRIGHKCYEVFGLIRSSALKKTHLIGNFANGDGVLLVQLALLGRFIRVPTYSFFARKHPEQSEAVYWWKLHSHRAWAEWFDPSNKDRLMFPYWKMYLEFFKAIRLADKKYQRKCYRIMIEKTFDNRMYLIREFLSPLTTFLRSHANS